MFDKTFGKLIPHFGHIEMSSVFRASDMPLSEITMDCPECDMKYQSYSGLHRHMAKCCPALNPKDVVNGLKFECDGCHREFRNQDNLYRHRKHTCPVLAPKVPIQITVNNNTTNNNTTNNVVQVVPPPPALREVEGAEEFMRRRGELIPAILPNLPDEELDQIKASIDQIQRLRALSAQSRPVDASELTDRKAIRAMVWARWVGNSVGEVICPLCKVCPMTQGLSNWHAAHVISKKDGGPLTVDNLRPICATCNLSMTSDSLVEYCREIPGALESLKIPAELSSKRTVAK